MAVVLAAARDLNADLAWICGPASHPWALVPVPICRWAWQGCRAVTGRPNATIDGLAGSLLNRSGLEDSGTRGCRNLLAFFVPVASATYACRSPESVNCGRNPPGAAACVRALAARPARGVGRDPGTAPRVAAGRCRARFSKVRSMYRQDRLRAGLGADAISMWYSPGNCSSTATATKPPFALTIRAATGRCDPGTGQPLGGTGQPLGPFPRPSW